MAIVVVDSTNPKYGTSVFTPTLVNAGSGYTAADILTINSGDTNATVTVDTVDGSGGILTYHRSAAGSGYSAGTYGVTGGTGASATFSITVQAGLSTVNGCYNVEAYQLGWSYGASTKDTVSPGQTIPVTFANSGNCKGVMLVFSNYITASNRNVIVTLQEYVGSTWTDRTSTTVTAAQINHGVTSEIGNNVYYFVKFATPYAVTTAASTWRFKVITSGGTKGTISLAGGTTGVFLYATWCDNAATFTDNDTLLIGDDILVDKSATISANTGYSQSAIIGSDAEFLWENTPLASYTLTVKGYVVIGDFAAFRVGTSTKRIPFAQQAIIDLQASPVSAAATGFYGGQYGNSPWTGGGCPNFYLYGEVPTSPVHYLNANANASQANIVLTSAPTTWVANDYVFVCKDDTTIWGDSTLYQVSSIVGTTVTLKTNLASKRISGGAVINFTQGWGILLKGYTTSMGQNLAETSNMYVSGVTCGAPTSAGTWSFTCTSTGYRNYDDTSNRGGINFSDSAFYGATVINGDCDKGGITIERVYTGGCRLVITNTNISASYPFTVKNCICGAVTVNGAIITQGQLHISTIEGNKFYNSSQQAAISLKAVNFTFKNNYFWASPQWTGYGGGQVNVYLGINPTDWSGNQYEKHGCGVLLVAGGVSKGIIAKNEIFGQEVAALYSDIGQGVGHITDIEIESPTGAVSVSSPESAMIDGNEIRVTDNNNVSNADMAYMKYGKTQRCGAGLTDTTVRTAGGYSLRLESTNSTNNLKWDVDIATGDLTNQTTVIGVWCKINNAAYWAGTNQMPRITVNYDNGSTAYGEAAATAGEWQYIHAVFTPLTSYGKITVTLSSRTDATTTNAYVYWQDWSGGFLVNTDFKLWANAFPVPPAYSFNVNAATFWDYPTSAAVATGSMGKFMKGLLTVGKFLGLK
jgi:hypothetical protein